MTDLTRHLRILQPAPGVFAYYDGRVPGFRFDPAPNWVDEGALSLGIASYALVRGDQAIVYDTHVGIAHAARIRAHLTGLGVRMFTVVLSHQHLDHVAGTEVFADCEIIANARTLAHLTRDRAAIEAGTRGGPPAIKPLILPNRVFSGYLQLTLGDLEVDLIEADIHSDDATVIWLPALRLLLAGDTVEDMVTYVVEPKGFARHLADLRRLADLEPLRILPNHGDPDRIASGGYGPELLDATADYISWLMRLPHEPDLAATPLQDVVAPWLANGTLEAFDAYDEVHAQNVAQALKVRA